jgi:Na+/melibiose symporter-like transporter
MICMALGFKYVTKDWLGPQTVCMAVIGVACVISWRWMPESPVYLVRTGRYEAAREAMDRIADINERDRVRWGEVRFKEEASNEESECLVQKGVSGDRMDQRYDIKNLTNDKRQYSNLVIMNVVWSSTSFGFYLISYYMKYIPGDIYTNVIMSSLADCGSSFISAWLGTKLGHKKALAVSFILSGILSLGLIF